MNIFIYTGIIRLYLQCCVLAAYITFANERNSKSNIIMDYYIYNTHCFLFLENVIILVFTFSNVTFV